MPLDKERNQATLNYPVFLLLANASHKILNTPHKCHSFVTTVSLPTLTVWTHMHYPADAVSIRWVRKKHKH